MPDYAALLSAAVPAVLDACRICRTVQANMDTVRAIVKDDNSPVTVADYACQAVIARGLSERLGEIILVGEETSAYLRNPAHTAQLEATLAAAAEVWPGVTEQELVDSIDMGAADTHHTGFWTLDPIDGTKGFLRGEQYAVSLAFVERGVPVVGLLGCPNLSKDFSSPLNEADPHGCLYTAVKGQGVYESAADNPKDHPVKLVRPHRNPSQPISLAVSVEESHSNMSMTQNVLDILAKQGQPHREPARLDSQAKYAVVARGQADAYLRLPTKKGYIERIWDHAAGALIASESGCAVTDALGQPLDFSLGRGLEKNRGIVAAPPRAHGLLIGAIKSLDL